MKKLLIILFTFTLVACSSSSRYQIKNDHGPSTAPTLAHIEDLNPRYEPYSRGGNKNYTVRGIDYKVFNGITEFSESGYASWYGNKFHGHLTSNGERYNMFAMSAAHKNLPLPSYVQVTNTDNGKQIIVRVNDRGPFHQGRIIDLSYAAAKKLSILKSGTAKVNIKLLHFAEEKDEFIGLNETFFIQYLVTSSSQKAQIVDEKQSKKHQVKTLVLKEKSLYKLRLGPINSQLKAHKLLIKIKQEYANAYIVQM